MKSICHDGVEKGVAIAAGLLGALPRGVMEAPTVAHSCTWHLQHPSPSCPVRGKLGVGAPSLDVVGASHSTQAWSRLAYDWSSPRTSTPNPEAKTNMKHAGGWTCTYLMGALYSTLHPRHCIRPGCLLQHAQIPPTLFAHIHRSSNQADRKNYPSLVTPTSSPPLPQSDRELNEMTAG